ncbi:MAG: phage portal protein [Planctomycetes bacterium]|nr:phage portal protein [Planctomycetota bacterium]
MGFWPWTKRVKATVRTAVRFIRAKFDSAQTTPDNRRHWANADGFSANAAASPEVRRILRNRSRYEVANNSYARGIVLTLANDVIGTGPRLQMLLDDDKANRTIESEFANWARAINLPEKLRTMRQARAQDGEAFSILFNNPGLGTPVKLDIKLIEAEQVSSSVSASLRRSGPDVANAVDGIIFDTLGNPVEYLVLKNHPGSGTFIDAADFDRVPAKYVIHWFRTDRPGQSRGLPDILPALPLFAQLRRYTLAVISAAESAANVAVLMKTNAPAGGKAAEVEPMTEMEFSPNMAVFTPEGWEPSQIKAEQPATTYEMFKREILTELARSVSMPYNIAAGNSSGYNYASGRLDHQTYYKSIRVEQSHCESVVLDRIFNAWLTEAVKVFPELTGPDFAKATSGTDAPHQWFWDGHEHVDPAKEANAQATRLASNTTTLANEYARQGKDWETELRQRAKEVQLCNELGLTVVNPTNPANPVNPPAANTPVNEPQQQDNSEGNDNGQEQSQAA